MKRNRYPELITGGTVTRDQFLHLAPLAIGSPAQDVDGSLVDTSADGRRARADQGHRVGDGYGGTEPGLRATIVGDELMFTPDARVLLAVGSYK